MLVARRKERLEELAAELTGEYGVRAEAIACDLGKAASRQRAARPDRRARSSRSTCWSTTPASPPTAPFDESDPARELEQVRVLVEAPVALTSAFLPGMVQRGRGAILNVASTAGMQPLPYSAGYSAAKAYVLTFSEALHHELGHGVTVTALAPGPVSHRLLADLRLGGRRRPDVREGRAAAGLGDAPSRPPRPASRAWRPAAGSWSRPARCARRCWPAHYLPHAVKLPAIEWAMRRR